MVLWVRMLLQELHIVLAPVVEVLDDGTSEVVWVGRVRSNMSLNILDQPLVVHISHSQVL